MLAAPHEITDLRQLLFIENHEDCSKCRKDERVPSPKGRCLLHRHNEKTFRVVDLLDSILGDYCKKHFPSANDGIVFLILRGLQAEGVLPGGAIGVADSQPSHQEPIPREPAPIESKEESPAPTNEASSKEEVQTEPSLWDEVTAPLKERVSEDNFRIWLSSVRFVTAQTQIVLGCHNTFFQEYLSEHYKDVIKEELQKLGERRDVVFEVIENPQPTEPPKEEAPLQEVLPKEELSSPVLSKIARRQEARRELADQCTTRLHGKFEFVVVKYSDDLKLLLAKEAEEDRLEALREQAAREEAWLDQQIKRSYYWSDDKATPKRIRKLAQQIERNDLKGTNKPKRE